MEGGLKFLRKATYVIRVEGSKKGQRSRLRKKISVLF